MSLLFHYLFWGHTVTSFVNTFVFDLYLPFFTSPIIHLLVCPPNLCMEPFFSFLLRKRNKRQGLCKTWWGGGGLPKFIFLTSKLLKLQSPVCFLVISWNMLAGKTGWTRFAGSLFFLTHGDERIGRDTLGMSFGTYPSFITWPSFVPVSSYWGQDKNWPTADWPVPSNDSRNNKLLWDTFGLYLPSPF